jgi:hypothetical protein
LVEFVVLVGFMTGLRLGAVQETEPLFFYGKQPFPARSQSPQPDDLGHFETIGFISCEAVVAKTRQ